MNELTEQKLKNIKKGIDLKIAKDNNKLSEYYNDLSIAQQLIDAAHLDIACYIFLRDFTDVLNDIDLKWENLPDIISSIEFTDEPDFSGIWFEVHQSKNEYFNEEEKGDYLEEIKSFLHQYFIETDVDFNDNEKYFWISNVKKIDCSKNIENQLMNSLPNNYYKVKKSINEFNNINTVVQDRQFKGKKKNKL